MFWLGLVREDVNTTEDIPVTWLESECGVLYAARASDEYPNPMDCIELQSWDAVLDEVVYFCFLSASESCLQAHVWEYNEWLVVSPDEFARLRRLAENPHRVPGVPLSLVEG